jgi:hypothetical protein
MSFSCDMAVGGGIGRTKALQEREPGDVEGVENSISRSQSDGEPATVCPQPRWQRRGKARYTTSTTTALSRRTFSLWPRRHHQGRLHVPDLHACPDTPMWILNTCTGATERVREEASSAACRIATSSTGSARRKPKWIEDADFDRREVSNLQPRV